MKKIVSIVAVLVIIILLFWKLSGSSSVVAPTPSGSDESSTTTLSASQTVKLSDKLSEYKNDELGFAIKYPTTWEKKESPANVTFDVSTINYTDKEKNTISTLQAKVDVLSAKCAFPPVTTVKERDTLKVGALTFNMISIANTVQNRSFFNRMYSLQKDSICYFFTFSSVTSSPASKGFTGVEAQKVGAQNKTLVDTADAQFKDMVKSFSFVVSPVGKDETTVSPKK